MKNFLLIIIFLNLFVVSSTAENIKDFQIENLSILDPLTKFITKKQILKKKNSYSDQGYIYKSKDFYSLTFYKDSEFNLQIYDEIQFHLKDKDNKFIIHAVTGAKYIEDMDKCVGDMKVIEKDLDNLFKNAKKFTRKKYEHGSKLGFVHERILYSFEDGNIAMRCETWQKSTGIKDGLVFDIYSKSMVNFLTNKAY